MIKIRNLKKEYNGKTVLSIESLDLIEGKKYAVLGQNGSGKTTFAKMLAGIIDGFKEKNNLNKTIGYNPQKPYIFDMSLENNIKINIDNLNHIDTKNKVENLIKDFKLEYLKGKNAKTFSGGEQQKLALARFIAKDYDIVILDEPTSAMDKNSIINVENIIKKYVENKTLILITHEIEQAKRLADYIIILEDGKIKKDGIV